VATIGIPIIIVTGFLQTWRLGGSLANLTDTTWGRILLAKVAIAALMVTIGGVSRWLLAHEGPSSLRRLVFTEAVCGMAVLGLAAGLVAQPPTVGPKSKVFAASLTEGGLIVDASITPGRVGSNEVHLVITPAGGSIAPVVSATARMSLPSKNLPNSPVTLTSTGPNHYTGTITLPFSGDWTLEITVEPKAGQSVLLRSAVPIP
jgi:copper transport protein